MSEYDKTEIKEHGCIHMGTEQLSNFWCTDCDDNAEDCNCMNCGGVYCDLCNSVYWVSCEIIRSVTK